MKTKHTTGPWITSHIFHNVTEESGISTYKIHKREDSERCPQICVSFEEATANAKLIERAPDLFAALVDFMKLVEDRVLIRDSSGDGNFEIFLTQSSRLVNVLSATKKLIDELSEEEK